MAFKSREKKREGVKFLFYGESASGKTPTGLSFPNQALIDSDSGTTFYDGDNVVVESNTLSFKQLNEDLDELELDSELFDQIETFNIDSVTRFHENMQHAALKVVEQRAKKQKRLIESEGLSPKEYGIMKLHYERFFGRMLSYSKEGKNLVFVAEQKDETENRTDSYGNQVNVKVGVMPSMQKGSKYDFDVVIRTYMKNGEPFGMVEKDRTGTFKVGEEIPKPNHSHWGEAINKAQKGKQRTKEDINNFEKAVDDQADNFNVVEVTPKDKLNEVVDGMSLPQKKEFAKKMNEVLGKHNYKDFTDESEIKKALELAKQV